MICFLLLRPHILPHLLPFRRLRTCLLQHRLLLPCLSLPRRVPVPSIVYLRSAWLAMAFLDRAHCDASSSAMATRVWCAGNSAAAISQYHFWVCVLPHGHAANLTHSALLLCRLPLSLLPLRLLVSYLLPIRTASCFGCSMEIDLHVVHCCSCFLFCLASFVPVASFQCRHWRQKTLSPLHEASRPWPRTG